MRNLNKARLLDHLGACITAAAKKGKTDIVTVLDNLKKEIKNGDFDEPD